MANADTPLGFRLIKTAGHEPIRRVRSVDSANSNAIAPGDAYTIEADGNITRCNGSTAPNGICEGIVLQGINEGPVSYQYLPAGVAGQVIGIEDPTAMFWVQTNAAIPLSAYDAGAEVNVVDAAPNATLGQSRQEVGDVGGSQLLLKELVDTPNNTINATEAKVIVGLLPANVQ